jgi:hypothetical protein
MRVAALAALLGSAAAQGPSPAPSPDTRCILAGTGATYDLTTMSTENGFYITNSRNNDDNSDGAQYGYYFSVCNNMLPPPGTSCNATTGSDGKVTSGPAPAFQICANPAKCGNACYRLGDTAANGVLSSFGWNPAHGVRMQYTGGDWCTPAGLPAAARSMALDFICYDQPGLIQSSDAVFEDITCGYHALLYSRVGCPRECPLVRKPSAPFGQARVCGGQGLCDYDTDKGAARCFCDSGWGGADCTSAGGAGAPPVSYPALGGTIIGGIVLGVALLFGGIYYRGYSSGLGFWDALNLFHRGGGGGGGATTGAYKQAPAEPAAYTAPEAPVAFASSSAPASTGYAPPSGSLNDGPLLA